MQTKGTSPYKGKEPKGPREPFIAPRHTVPGNPRRGLSLGLRLSPSFCHTRGRAGGTDGARQQQALAGLRSRAVQTQGSHRCSQPRCCFVLISLSPRQWHDAPGVKCFKESGSLLFSPLGLSPEAGPRQQSSGQRRKGWVCISDEIHGDGSLCYLAPGGEHLISCAAGESSLLLLRGDVSPQPEEIYRLPSWETSNTPTRREQTTKVLPSFPPNMPQAKAGPESAAPPRAGNDTAPGAGQPAFRPGLRAGLTCDFSANSKATFPSFLPAELGKQVSSCPSIPAASHGVSLCPWSFS